MQLNKIKIIKEFKQYLNIIDKKANKTKNSSLASFSFEVNGIELVTLLSSNLLKNTDTFYWNIHDEKIEYLACFPLVNVNEYGQDRLIKTRKKINELSGNFISNWQENNLKEVPLFVGGIKFAPKSKNGLWNDFSDSDWFIPQILFIKNVNRTYIIYNFLVYSDSLNIVEEFLQTLIKVESIIIEPIFTDNHDLLKSEIYSNSYDSWEKIVNEALYKISQGLLSKVVLSREVKLQFSKSPSIPAILKSLSKKYPKCYVYAYQRGDSIFIGASPEKLAKVSKGWIEVDALAGSSPRGNTETEDIEMENFLLNSEKNLFEQRAVINFIHNLLNKISDDIYFDEKPIIRKLPNIQHLWTVIKAKLKEDYKLFDVLMKLHPTPAICGDPWRIAQDYILEKEPHDRGLYSGNIGWFNFYGCGEFAVGIRSALVKSTELYAYAGCGIVEGSEAGSEFEESEIKLKPILSLFIDEKVYQS